MKIKAKVVRHRISDNTGMLHLDDLGLKKRREIEFPVNEIFECEPAHWFGEIQVFRLYKNNREELDYFGSDEIEILNPKDLKEQYPQAYNMDYQVDFIDNLIKPAI